MPGLNLTLSRSAPGASESNDAEGARAAAERGCDSQPRSSKGVDLTTAALAATGCGTAIASVCAFGLFQIERLLGGLWSVLAVVVAGSLCAVLARTFARLSEVVPSGAGLLAYLSRGLGRRAGLLIVGLYLLLTLFLIGAEATIVGLLFARLVPAPPFVGALAFLLGTWLLCRAGVRVSHRAQSIATWGLIGALGTLSIVMIARSALHGELLQRLAVGAPSAGAFLAGVGQALFLFMGFELITSQAEVASARSIRRGLGVSVIVLTAFYATVSLGFSCMGGAPEGEGAAFIPQIGLAEHGGGPLAILLVAVLSLLASFTSYNGALLALSRFAGALASQGVLPRRLAKVTLRTRDAGDRGLIPGEALSALLLVAILFTALIGFGGLIYPAVLAAAVSAAGVYAGALWVGQRPPFSDPSRSRALAFMVRVLALGFIALGVGVLVDAGPDRFEAMVILGVALFAVIAASYRGRGAIARASRRPERAGLPNKDSIAAHQQPRS